MERMIIMMLGNDHRNDDHFDSDDKDDEMEAHLPARRVLNDIQVDDHVSPLGWGETKRPGNKYKTSSIGAFQDTACSLIN